MSKIYRGSDRFIFREIPIAINSTVPKLSVQQPTEFHGQNKGRCFGELVYTGKMRSDVVIIIATVGLLFTEGTRCSRSYNHYVKHRTKPREIRGFKPEYLSTAIGFGKRDSPFGLVKPQNQQNLILALLQKTSQRLEKSGRISCKQRNTYRQAMCE
ncbi:uncharacterized protein LOC107219304 [Neodiprion lecontei]|uniref:Uncharacterized protein LOC107219304 n=1 Tax=Neodiprion lecontei TaxID=441921 RepID=A0A6J0BFN6_NEOLC|nr:uncharacterized protein LOC107219304 [Neodiprion lecontei]